MYLLTLIMVIAVPAVVEALRRNREKIRSGLESLVNEEVEVKIKEAERYFRRAFYKAFAGMSASFGATYLSIFYLGPDSKDLYSILPLLAATFIGAPYTIYQVIRGINESLIVDEGEILLKKRSEALLFDEQLQLRIDEALKKDRTSVRKARITAGATALGSAALYFVDRKLNNTVPWFLITASSGFIYMMGQYFKSMYYANVADETREILRIKHQSSD